MHLPGAGSDLVGRGVFGPAQGADGQFLHRGTHACGFKTCRAPAVVAVFGKLTASAEGWARFNVCREHVMGALREVVEGTGWFAAIAPANPSQIGGYCPHCGQEAAKIGADGRGHLRLCPIALSWPDRARDAGVPHEVHDRTECEVCVCWIQRTPGPAG